MELRTTIIVFTGLKLMWRHKKIKATEMIANFQIQNLSPLISMTERIIGFNFHPF
jgi:hypothetical protein